MANQLQQATLDKLNIFANSITGGVDSQAYQAVYNALTNSPDLAQSVNSGIISNQINGFSPTSAINVGGQFDPASKNILIPIDAVSGNLTNNLTSESMVFVLGHEVRHSVNADKVNSSYQDFKNEVNYLASLDGVQDYTHALLTLQKTYANDEASAQISGWNAVVSKVNSSPGTHQFSDYISASAGYYGYFASSTGVGLSGLTLNSDYTINLTQDNINAEESLYFYNPNTHVSGTTYPYYYGVDELRYIASKNLGNEVGVDMKALQLDAFVMQHYNMLGLSAGQELTIYDQSSEKWFLFDQTNDGTQLGIKRPISVPDGKETETLNYDENDDLIKTEHDWENSSGRGHDEIDRFGNATGNSQDADGTSHWFFRNIDGSHGAGYSGNIASSTEIYNSDGTYNINFRNYQTGASKSSYLNSDGSYGNSSHGEDGSDYSYTHNPDNSYSETSSSADGYNSSKYQGADGSYSENITYADSSTHNKYISRDGSIYISDVHRDESYTSSYELVDGTTSETTGDGHGNEDTVLHLADDTEVHIWKKDDGSSGSEHTDTDGTLTEHFYDADHSEHTDVYKESGDYTEMTVHDDGTFESVKFDTASGVIAFETYDNEKTRHSWSYSKAAPELQHTDVVTYADGSWVAEVVEANGDYQYSTLDANGNLDISFRSTLDLYTPDGEWALTVTDEGVQHSDRIGIISLEEEETIRQLNGSGKTDESVWHISMIRTDSTGFDEIKTEISENGVDVVGQPTTTHHFYS